MWNSQGRVYVEWSCTYHGTAISLHEKIGHHAPQKRCSSSSNWFDFQGKTGMLGLGSVFWIHHLVTWLQIYSKLCQCTTGLREVAVGFSAFMIQRLLRVWWFIRATSHDKPSRHKDEVSMAPPLDSALWLRYDEFVDIASRNFNMTWQGKITMFTRRYIFSIVMLVFRGVLCCWLYWI